MEYLVFPKLLGLAERAWAASPAWEQAEGHDTRERLLGAAWNEFANRLGQRELPRLCYLAGGVSYRLPLPGAVVEGGLLKASAAFPGLAIRYTTDGTEPTAGSTMYGGPVPAEGTIKLKSFAASERGSRTSTVVAPKSPGKVANQGVK
jgi:hexosaminidase